MDFKAKYVKLCLGLCSFHWKMTHKYDKERLVWKCESLSLCTEAEKNIQKPLTSMSSWKRENALGNVEDQTEFTLRWCWGERRGKAPPSKSTEFHNSGGNSFVGLHYLCRFMWPGEWHSMLSMENNIKSETPLNTSDWSAPQSFWIRGHITTSAGLKCHYTIKRAVIVVRFINHHK